MVANFGRFLLQDSEYDCLAGEEVDGLLDEADYCQLPQFGPSCRRRWCESVANHIFMFLSPSATEG